MLYECPKCHHQFDGKRNKCPKCGTKFYYGCAHEQLANKIAIYDEIIEKERKDIIKIFLPGIKVVQSIKFAVSILVLTLAVLLMLLPFIYLLDYAKDINSLSGMVLYFKGLEAGSSYVSNSIDLYCLILFLFASVLALQGIYLFVINLLSLRKKKLEKILFLNYRSNIRSLFVRFLDRTSQASYNAIFCLFYLSLVPFKYNNFAIMIYIILGVILIADFFVNTYLGSLQREMRKDKRNRPEAAYR